MLRSALPLLTLLTALGAGLSSCAEPALEPSARADARARVWITPASAAPGVPRTVEIWGSATHFDNGPLSADFGPGVEVGVMIVDSPHRARAQVVVEAGTPLGARDVTVTWGSQGQNRQVLRAAFVVESGALASTPERAAPGQTFSVEVTGFNTSFSADLTQASLGEGVELRDLAVLTPGRLTVTAHILLDAAVGARELVVYNVGGDVWTLSDALWIDRVPRSSSIAPDEADQGQLLEVRVQLDGAALEPDDEVELDLGTGVVVEDSFVVDHRTLGAELRVGNNARVGPRDVEAYLLDAEGGPVAYLLPDAFTIYEVPANPLRARASLSFGISRSFDPDSCAFRETVSASARFYEPNDFPCPSSGASSSFLPPPQFDLVSSGHVQPSEGSTDCPSSKTFDAGPQVTLRDPSSGHEVVMARNVTFAGAVSYRASDLVLADYLEDTSFDLITPGGDLGWSELPPWEIAEALVTMPRDFRQLGPDYCGLSHPLDEPLHLRWEAAGTYDVATMYLYLMGAPGQDGVPVMMVFPWDDGDWTYSPDALSFFDPGWASLVQAAYRRTRFEVPGSELPLAGYGSSALTWRGLFEFGEP